MVPTALAEGVPSFPLNQSSQQMDPRAEIRVRLRRLRRALTPRERRERSLQLVRRLATSRVFLASRHIALYLPNDGEVDLRPLIRRAWAMGKRCYLPVLGPVHHNRLWFAPYSRHTPLRTNRFGIPEPVTRHRGTRPPWGLDLILMPLVAFDTKCNRLGMGGGFYDRTLAYLSLREHWQRPRLVGVAYEFQRCEQLPSRHWDVPLHAIATDDGLRAE